MGVFIYILLLSYYILTLYMILLYIIYYYNIIIHIIHNIIVRWECVIRYIHSVCL